MNICITNKPTQSSSPDENLCVISLHSYRTATFMYLSVVKFTY